MWKHTTKTHRGYVWEDVTRQQRPFHWELTGYFTFRTLPSTAHTSNTTPRWFQDPRCRTSDRQPTPSWPTTWHYDGDSRRERQKKTETDEDEDRRRWTQSRTKTDSLWERANWQLALLQLTTPRSEHRTCYFSQCDPLTPGRMEVKAISAAPGPVVEPPQSSRFLTCFHENVEL